MIVPKVTGMNSKSAIKLSFRKGIEIQGGTGGQREILPRGGSVSEIRNESIPAQHGISVQQIKF